MRRPLTILLIAIVLSAHSTVARGQDEPKVGLTMGYPSAIGVLWQVADRIAIRPEMTFSKGSTESSSTDPIVATSETTTPSDNWQVGVGVSALFYLTRADALRTYVTPRFAYATTSASSNLSGTLVSSTSDGWAYTTSGAFGAQYSLGRHFGLFGEIGVSYTSSTTRASNVETITTIIGTGPTAVRTTSVTLRSDLHVHSFGSRSGVGIIFYF